MPGGQCPGAADVSSTLLAAGLAHALAVQYDLTGDPEAASAAIEAYQLAAGDARLAVFRRLHVAQAGAVLAARCGETAVSLSLYALAVELLDSGGVAGHGATGPGADARRVRRDPFRRRGRGGHRRAAGNSRGVP